jgi:hypothetical protein
MMRGTPLFLLMLLSAAPTLAAEYRRPSTSQIEEMRRWLCPNGGAPVRGAPGRCNAGGRRTAAGSGFGLPAPGWDRGLPAASRVQSACPEGTKPVLARGHDDVTRCLPG